MLVLVVLVRSRRVGQMSDGDSVRFVGDEATAAQVADAVEAAVRAPPGVSRLPDWSAVAQRTAEIYDAIAP